MAGVAEDPAAVERGRELFDASGCAGCHGSDGGAPAPESHDVGTDGRFQAPRLAGVAARSPYLHDGRAATRPLAISGRAFDAPDAHGDTADLDDVQRADLVAYLRSL